MIYFLTKIFNERKYNFFFYDQNIMQLLFKTEEVEGLFFVERVCALHWP
jgi:hypothetical protein